MRSVDFDYSNLKSHTWVLKGIASDVKIIGGRKDYWHEKWECSKCGMRINSEINVNTYDIFNPPNTDPGRWLLNQSCDEQIIEGIINE